MKKKILGVTLIVTLAVVAAFNINLSKLNAKGDLALTNVEALAEAEGGGTDACATNSYTAEFYNTCPQGEVLAFIHTNIWCESGNSGGCLDGYSDSSRGCYNDNWTSSYNITAKNCY